MNVFVAVVCVNLITLVNAVHDINYETILKILKGKPRIIDYTKIEASNGQLEKVPITSKVLNNQGNSKPWPDDQFELLNSEDTNHYYKAKNEYSRKGLKNKSLMKNILINKYRGNEELEYDKSEENHESSGDSQGNTLNAVQNSIRVQVYKNPQRPSTIIFLLGPRQENNTHFFHNTRRKDILLSSDEDDSDTSESYEKNPGNPFTIHKNKYKQNWPYNHYMDGDHMNINPFGPQFANLGPTGPDLFFGRKWWYFNQDDYKPIG